MALDGLSYYETENRAWNKLKYKRAVISSPNVNWCPSLRSLDHSIVLRADRTFRAHNPTSWPQFFHPDLPYLPCIPASNSHPKSSIHLLCHGLSKEQVVFMDLWDDGLCTCSLSEDLSHDLKFAMDALVLYVESFDSTTSHPHHRLHWLMQLVQIAANRLTVSLVLLPKLHILPLAYFQDFTLKPTATSSIILIIYPGLHLPPAQQWI